MVKSRLLAALLSSACLASGLAAAEPSIPPAFGGILAVDPSPSPTPSERTYGNLMRQGEKPAAKRPTYGEARRAQENQTVSQSQPTGNPQPSGGLPPVQPGLPQAQPQAQPTPSAPVPAPKPMVPASPQPSTPLPAPAPAPVSLPRAAASPTPAYNPPLGPSGANVPVETVTPLPELPTQIPEPAPDTSRILPLTLQEAGRLALAKSPRVGAALAKVRQSESEEEVAAAPARPHGAATIAGPPPSRNLLRQNLYFSPVRVEVRQLLIDGGKYQAKIDQLKAQTDSNSQQAVAEWHQLHLDVTLAYLEALRARAQEKVAQESVAQAQAALATAEKRFAAGDVPKGDVLLARVPQGEAELEVARARAAARDREEALNLLLGLPIDTPLDLSPPPPVQALGSDLAGCIAQAKEQRPLLRAARWTVVAAQYAISAAERDQRPQLALSAGIVTLSGDSYINQTGVSGGLELSWPFLDGGYSKNLTKAAQASRDQASLRLQEQEREAEGEVRRAYRAVEVSRLAATSSGLQVEQAADAYRIASAQYRAGMVPYYPLRQAQLDLLRSRQANSGALYDYLSARARLDFARGQEPDPAATLPTKTRDFPKLMIAPPPANLPSVTNTTTP